MNADVTCESHMQAARTAIRNNAELSSAFMLMNMLAATIASYGLFANSPAVIIGAMIIAMLLGPITGTSLALVDSDMVLLGRSLTTLAAGAAGVILTSLVLGFVHYDMPVTSEMMARATPNLSDLMIALAGGAAGAYATVSPRLSVAFVGVAIATALVPPLCAASILFARGEYIPASGALLLTFTNIVAIQFASSAVFWMTGFRRISKVSGLSGVTFLKRNSVSIVILCVLAVILTGSLRSAIARRLYESSTEHAIEQHINSADGYHLAAVRFDESGEHESIIRAVVRGPKALTPEHVAT